MRDTVEYKDLRTIRYFFIEKYTEKEVKLLRKAVAGTWSNVMKTPDGFFSVSFKENMDIYFELEIGDIIEVCLGRASLHKKLSYESVMIRKKFKNTDLLIDGCLVEKCNDSEDHLIKFDTINSDVSNYLWSLTGFTYYLKNLSSVYIDFSDDCTGAGIISNGEIVRGKYNFAGEFGFIPIDGAKTLDDIINEKCGNEEYVETLVKLILIINYTINLLCI